MTTTRRAGTPAPQRDADTFIRESNRIEGIYRNPTDAEIAEYHRFMELESVTAEELERFVSVYQPGAVLRTRLGNNVRVGGYYPPPGGPQVWFSLLQLLENMEDLGPYQTHVQFETLHPFDDCNGRLGRILWAWQMRKQERETRLPFLQAWYYASLSESRNEVANERPGGE